MRRMEDREPNLLSHTVHSVTRKGLKKRDLSDIELREILSELLPLVRMDHILPPNSEALAQVRKLGSDSFEFIQNTSYEEFHRAFINI